MASRIAFRVHPSSATICSFVNLVKVCKKGYLANRKEKVFPKTDVVGPGVDTDLMPAHVLFNNQGGPFNDTRSDDKESSVEIFLLEFCKQSTGKEMVFSVCRKPRRCLKMVLTVL